MNSYRTSRLFFLAAISTLVAGISSPSFAITVTLEGKPAGAVGGAVLAPAEVFGMVTAIANGEKRSIRDPLLPAVPGKRLVPPGAIDANVPDFTVGAAPDDATAGGRAQAIGDVIVAEHPVTGAPTPASVLGIKLRAKADQNGKGTAESQSIVSTDPVGFFNSLDGDGLFNDVMMLFLIESAGVPIFNDIDPESDSGSFSITASTQGDFFDGAVYTIGASISGFELPIPSINIAPNWQIFEIMDFGQLINNYFLSANFFSGGLTVSEFGNAWTDYITAPNGSGFGGSSSFGAWFVKRDIPNDQLGTWTWDGSIEVTAAAVPEPATLALITLGLAGIGFQRYRTQKVV